MVNVINIQEKNAVVCKHKLKRVHDILKCAIPYAFMIFYEIVHFIMKDQNQSVLALSRNNL